MVRVVKRESVGNIQLEHIPIPNIGPREILIRTHASLISAGSEIGGRFRADGAVDPARMGYSAAGQVVSVGSEVKGFQPGDRVAALAPHAEYLVIEEGNRFWAHSLPDDVSYERATFLPLGRSALRWIRTAQIEAGENVVILGQGLVGSLLLQTLRREQRRRNIEGRVIVVDGHALRLDLARSFGADVAINFKETDVEAAVKEATNGRGADLVIDAVGGPAGRYSFETGQTITRVGGRLMLVGLYHEAPLTIQSSFLMTRRLFGANVDQPRWGEEPVVLNEVLSYINTDLHTEEMISHRMPYTQAPEAFDLLANRPSEATAVVLQWPPVLGEGEDEAREHA